MIKKEKKQSKTQLPQPEKGMDPQSEEELTGLLSRLHIPPGVALNDIFLDNEDVSRQLHICKRVLTNLRKNGDLSFTQLARNGKVFYLKQELAAKLKQNIVIGKNSPLGKAGFKSISPLITLFSFCPAGLEELVNMLMAA